MTACSYQRNFNHIFANIPILLGSKKEDFFEWLERLQTACLQSACDIHAEALGITGDGVWDCLLGMPTDQPLAASRELKRYFSDVSSLGHAAAN